MTGRYHRGLDRFPADESWPALYLTLAPQIALAERIRHATPDQLARLNGGRLSRLRVELGAVLACCELPACLVPAVPGLNQDDVCRPFDFRVTHALAAAARGLDCEAMLVPSCSRLSGGNLVVFPDRLRPGSTLEFLDSEDPELYRG